MSQTEARPVLPRRVMAADPATTLTPALQDELRAIEAATWSLVDEAGDVVTGLDPDAEDAAIDESRRCEQPEGWARLADGRRVYARRD